MGKEIKLTKEGYEKLQLELEQLKTERRREVAEKIKVALSFGDLSENSEYDEAKNEQAMVEARITELEQMLKNASLIDETQLNSDIVNIGSKVRLKNMTEKAEVTYYVVGSTEADIDEGKISDESPLGKALLGHKAGQTVTFEAPCGTLKYKILDIEK